MHVMKDDIDLWRKQVEMASDFEVSKVISRNKERLVGTDSLPVPLQTSDQLRDHDDAYSEAQGLLSDWFGSKLRLELKTEDEEEDDPAVVGINYDNFHDLYTRLAEEEEGGTVDSILRDLMEREVFDCGVMEELALDVGQTKKKIRDPIVAMEARHLQVRENRARREAERQRRQRAREALRDARVEAKKRRQREETRRKQEAQSEEEMVQREEVRLRRQAEEKRCREQRLRQRGNERIEGQRAARSLHSAPPLSTNAQQQDLQRLHVERKIQCKRLTHNLKCLRGHFSGWYSVVLDRRLRMGKARALCDWKRQLRAWRAWRAAVWAGQRQRELGRTEQEPQAENRQSQLAAENDRNRLLRRCLNEWQLWCRMEKERRQLLTQQQKTRRKMAALIQAASTGMFSGTEAPAHQPVTAQPEESNQPDTRRDRRRSGPLAPDTSSLHRNQTPVGTAGQPTRPTRPWQVTRRHAAPTPAELREARQRREGGISDPPKGASSLGGRFESRHAVQQQVITQQRKLLKEQQEQIATLRQQQSVELEKRAPLTQLSAPGGPRPKSHSFGPSYQPYICSPSLSKAMEGHARKRAERRKEIEELKRKKEDDKLAEAKAAEDQRLREMEEEKLKAAENKKEEKRQEREREEEKQRQLKRRQQLLKLAHRHYRRNVLLRRGLAPWQRLVQLRQADVQLAESHHDLALLRSCTLGWRQSARESLSEKKAYANQLYRHFLLRRSLSCWKRLKDRRMVQAERAERFYRIRTLRRFLSALLDHVTRERLVGRDRREKADEHNDRRMTRRCFLAWRQIPCLLRIERAKEKRRERLGRRVAEVLPDFCGYPQRSLWKNPSPKQTTNAPTCILKSI
ncbi:coiled-coil domain-containing protein 191-like [Brachionichthys hirsutus]|uniref:coiled-coil domain-containing protein 191-like n=1 Tax=Brachionichthys hirsutus TaxID=412623 RepID=UPI0036052FC8